MLPRPSLTLDDLLADSLIQTVMQADGVEPEAVRALMDGALVVSPPAALRNTTAWLSRGRTATGGRRSGLRIRRWPHARSAPAAGTGLRFAADGLPVKPP